MTNENKVFPLVPVRGLLVFPKVMFHIDVGRERSVWALERSMAEDHHVFLSTQKRMDDEFPEPTDLYQVGVVAKIKQVMDYPNGTLRALIEGVYRAKIETYEEEDEGEGPYLVEVTRIEEIEGDKTKTKAYMRQLKEQMGKYYQLAQKAPHRKLINIFDIHDPGNLADAIIMELPIEIKQKQSLLETLDIEKRMERLIELLSNEKEIVQLENEISKRVKKSMEQTQKEYYLREQLKAIQKELDGEDGKTGEVGKLRQKIKASDMTEHIREVALRELARYESISQNSAESYTVRNYIDWLIALPWTTKTEEKIEVDTARKILDRDHYGLEKVKERILEYLAVQKLTNSLKGPIICLVGPPGVGKTSLARSIAESINRRFVRVSLGGVRDEAEIRGHRRTYVGAMPGRIIQGIKKAETINPVFLLDELDKMSNAFRGDPSAAMLEVLDPEQNKHFSDHFIEEPYDLSQVMFIATANSVQHIPAPLLDRMELISLSGYTEYEKLHIAKEYLIPKQLEENGLTKANLQIRKDALQKVIRRHTREAGVRNLERKIAAICRKTAKIIISEKQQKVIVTEKRLDEFLGKPRFSYGLMEETNQVGTATGLAYTSAGGDILSIEVAHYPGKGKLVLTGKLGEVMRESAQAAFSYIRTRTEQLNIDSDFHEKYDIHIHVPEGATPKDGPSAGITMATALVSSLTGRPVKKEVAMTGEITLRGRVLPIGGLKEKSLGAHRAGMTTIIIPKENVKDIDDVPESVRSDLQFIDVSHLDQVLEHALMGE